MGSCKATWVGCGPTQSQQTAEKEEGIQLELQQKRKRHISSYEATLCKLLCTRYEVEYLSEGSEKDSSQWRRQLQYILEVRQDGRQQNTEISCDNSSHETNMLFLHMKKVWPHTAVTSCVDAKHKSVLLTAVRAQPFSELESWKLINRDTWMVLQNTTTNHLGLKYMQLREWAIAMVEHSYGTCGIKQSMVVTREIPFCTLRSQSFHWHPSLYIEIPVCMLINATILLRPDQNISLLLSFSTVDLDQMTGITN